MAGWHDDVTDPGNLPALLGAIYGGSPPPGMRSPQEAAGGGGPPQRGQQSAGLLDQPLGVGEAQAEPSGGSRFNEPPPTLEQFQQPPEHLKRALEEEIRLRNGYGPRAKEIQRTIDDHMRNAQQRYDQAMQSYMQRQKQHESHVQSQEKMRNELPFSQRNPQFAQNLPWYAIGASAALPMGRNMLNRMFSNKTIRAAGQYADSIEDRLAKGAMKSDEKRGAIKGLNAELSAAKRASSGQDSKFGDGAVPGAIAGAGIGWGSAMIPQETDLQYLDQNSPYWKQIFENMGRPETWGRAGIAGMAGAGAGLAGAKAPVPWPRATVPVGQFNDLRTRLSPTPKPKAR